ncbi:histidine phosphatase family protein [Magnetococcus sp. PR-3]|uniref:histidine phosphatase family protein n=1 Tax=Magnetococcus sp. PR-3 TaxID=3120355 RepID=UPI002FCE2B7A
MNKLMDGYGPTIDLIRHGEPQGGDRYRGRLDDPLSETGWTQMRAAVGPDEPWDQIITSPLKRCLYFAEALAEQRELPLAIELGLQELSFGSWEGRTAKEILSSPDGPALTAFWRDPWSNPPPDGESLANFEKRVTTTLLRLIKAHKGQHLLIVGHGGILRLVTAWALGMPMNNLSRLVTPYACRIRIAMDQVDGQPLPRLIHHMPTGD